MAGTRLTAVPFLSIGLDMRLISFRILPFTDKCNSYNNTPFVCLCKLTSLFITVLILMCRVFLSFIVDYLLLGQPDLTPPELALLARPRILLA